MKLKFTFLFFVLCSFHSFSQNSSEYCGTKATAESLNYFNNIKDKLEELDNAFLNNYTNRTSTQTISVPIKAHVIRTVSGTGGLTITSLTNALNIVNNYYANAGLNFYLCEGVNYIDSNEYYDFNTSEENALTSANNVANVINIYFANSVSTSNGSVCGYAYFPGGPETILMDNSCTTNGSTLSHEIGHFFGLQHTHGASNDTLTNELVNGTNCSSAGDFICDTPADPQLGNSNVDPTCTYTGNVTDANGEFFNPNPNSIMSYSRRTCRNEFSPQQYARINSIFRTSRANLTCTSFNVDFVADKTSGCENTLTVNFTDNSVGATSWEWDVNGDDVIDYTTQNPTHTYTTAGEYDVALTISDGGTSISNVKRSYIEVGPNFITATQVKLTLRLDNAPSETSWQFVDGNNNVLYSGGGYDDTSDAGALINETFDVVQNQCYQFIISDSAGNGLCCDSGQGSYKLSTNDNIPIASSSGFDNTAIESMYTGTTLGTNEFNKDAITLYPNPSNSEIHLLMSNSSLPDRYEIYNTLGQIIKNKAILSENDLKINVKSFRNGVYYIKVKKDNSQIVYSFIKN